MIVSFLAGLSAANNNNRKEPGKSPYISVPVSIIGPATERKAINITEELRDIPSKPSMVSI